MHDALTDQLDQLRDTQEIALTIFDPGDFDRPHRRHAVDGRERGQIVLFKDHSSCFQSSHLGLEIVNRPAQLGMGSAGCPARWKDQEVCVATTVKDAFGLFTFRCQAKLFAVEALGSFQISCR